MTPILLSAHERTVQPWKNGGGVTREIAAFPPGAEFGDFQWRVSTAIVASAGPFSRFFEVDRTLAVLSGSLSLVVEKAEPRLLTASDAPFSFSGDANCFGEPIDTPVHDLNVMVRRSCFNATVRRSANGSVSVPAGTTCLCIAVDNATVSIEEAHCDLGPMDALLMDPAEDGWVMTIAGGVVFVIMLNSVKPGAAEPEG